MPNFQRAGGAHKNLRAAGKKFAVLVWLNRDLVAGLAHQPGDVINRGAVAPRAGVAVAVPLGPLVLIGNPLERLHMGPQRAALDAGREFCRRVVRAGCAGLARGSRVRGGEAECQAGACRDKVAEQSWVHGNFTFDVRHAAFVTVRQVPLLYQ